MNEKIGNNEFKNNNLIQSIKYYSKIFFNYIKKNENEPNKELNNSNKKSFNK